MEARWSTEYLKRQEYMRNKVVPTISQVKTTAGLPLALVIFEECHEELQEDLGLKPPLEGPRGELWVSPSDLLIGKVVLKPPLTQKHIQALTHQGILEIGGDVEQKLINEMRIERDKAVREKEDYLTKIFEFRKNELTHDIREEARKRYGEKMNDMRLFFENKICQLLWECYEQVRQLEEQMQIEFDSLNVLWEAKLEQEVQNTVDRITEEFLEKMRKQEKVLVSIFTKRIKTLKMKKKCAVDFERIKCKELIIQMKHKLHCQNIADLMYLLCKERRKCRSEKISMDDHRRAIIRKHKFEIERKNRRIKDLVKQKKKKIRQLNVRERCLIEILRQFQKFIYFAFKAAPTQGEFLLNINKLIKFEIEDYCISEEREKKTKKKSTVAEVKEKPTLDICAEIETFLGAFVTDEERLEYSDVLPAFYFNEKMYVREDFRDKFSAGIELTQNDSLWNPDVEELLNIFKKNMDEKKHQIDKIKSQISSVHFPPDSPDKSSSDIFSDQILTVSPEHSPSSSPRATPIPPLQITPVLLKQLHTPESQRQLKTSSETSMSKKTFSTDDSERVIRKVSLAPSAVEEIKKIKKQDDDFDIRPSTKDATATQSKLTLARDSIILHISNMERKSLVAMSKMTDETLSKASDKISKILSEEEEPLEGIDYRDDEDLRVQSQRSLVETESKPTSKLLLATDSYEIIRSHMGLVIDKSEEKAQEKPKRKSQLSFQAKVTKVPLEPEHKRLPKTKKAVKTPPKKPATPRTPAKVVGSRKTKEHEKPIEIFTEERISSLVNMMKENPSLLRLFTPCSK